MKTLLISMTEFGAALQMCTPGKCLILLILFLALVSVSIAPSILSGLELWGHNHFRGTT